MVAPRVRAPAAEGREARAEAAAAGEKMKVERKRKLIPLVALIQSSHLAPGEKCLSIHLRG